MPDLPPARAIRLAGLWSGAHGTVVLDHDARFLRRKRLQTTAGDGFLVDLDRVVNLGHGDALVLDDGRMIGVEAAEEPLLEIRGDGLARLAWHIGNRHTPCQIEPDRLLIRADPVLEDMLRRLGARLAPLLSAFRPEGGAYGMGRTMGHSHGPGDHHGHSHAWAAGAATAHAGATSHRHVHFHVSHLPGDDGTDSGAE